MKRKIEIYIKFTHSSMTCGQFSVNQRKNDLGYVLNTRDLSKNDGHEWENFRLRSFESNKGLLGSS